jgi:hypothetical protein
MNNRIRMDIKAEKTHVEMVNKKLKVIHPVGRVPEPKLGRKRAIHSRRGHERTWEKIRKLL